jgi:nicotinamide-nucleotide amidase
MRYELLVGSSRGETVFSIDQTTEAAALLDALRARGWRCATAESCTGGLVSALLTAIPGSSDVVDRGFVTYSNDAKREMLDVRDATLATHGAVSAATAAEMARGALAHSRADIAVAITGIAGPGGGSPEKPVGLVVFAAATSAGCDVVERRFGARSRDEIRQLSVHQALGMLRAAASAP